MMIEERLNSVMDVKLYEITELKAEIVRTFVDKI